MNQTLLNALNEQLTRERQNAAVYDALSAALDVVAWLGSSAWMKKQAGEEREHADAFAAFIVDRDGVPQYAALNGCNCPSGDGLAEYFAAALELERANTEALNSLYYLAEEMEDPQLCVFLHPFIAGQTEDVRRLADFVMQLQRMDKTGAFVFDKSLT